MSQRIEAAARPREESPAPGGGGGMDDLFAAGGEMARQMRAMDWSKTPLGPVVTWSPSLRMMVRFMLPNRFPLLLWWGPEFLQLYNDAYRPVLGTKHPQYLGRPVRECWSEILDVIGPLIETPFNGGPATWMEDILLEVNRHGFLEETHFTIGYSPVPDETAPGGIGGVMATVHEISDKVVTERRVVALRDLGARSTEAKTATEACRVAAEILGQHPKDIPFALLYLIDPDGQHARLAASAGVEQDSSLGPLVVDLGAEAAADAGDSAGWPLTGVVRSETLRVVDDLASRFEAVPPGPWSDPPTSAVVAPIRSNTAHRLAGLLVAGVSARLRLDDTYVGFYDLISSQIASALAAAHAYEEERRRAEALAEIDRAKTAFFSNVSHEFRTPLTLLLGSVQDALADPEEELSPRQRERLLVMQRNGMRLLKLVNTLLDFARIEAGRVQAAYEPTDLAAYTAELASAFRSLVEQAGLELVVDCPPLAGLPEPVYVDREMWEKIVLNLLSNAFKFTLEGSIAVSLRAVDAVDGADNGADNGVDNGVDNGGGGGRQVELTVRDTGTGVPPEELPRLFERFHRVEGARARTHEGSGIGLALVQELVHLHGGTIRAESAAGLGTTFFVRLPVGAAHLPADRIGTPATLAATALASTALGAAPFVREAERWLPAEPAHADDALAPLLADAPARRQPRGAERPARIVLADDNADMRDYLRRLLGERYAVEAVANGAAALAAIRRAPPDLVLSDVMMPELDGVGLLRALRAEPATAATPVILLSARAGEEATAEGLAAGADDYLVKPFSAREVLSRIAARLEIARVRAAAERRTHEALEALLETARELVATDARVGVREMAGRLVTLAREVVGSEIVSLASVDAATGHLQPLATIGRSPSDEAAWHATLGQHRIAEYYDEAQLGRLQAGEVVVLDLAHAALRSLPAYSTRTTATAPLAAGGRLVGILSLAYGAAHTYGADELALMTSFAQMAQLILQRERLLAEREESRARILALDEANRRMDEFLGVAGHELRTPLTSIMATVQISERQVARMVRAALATGDPLAEPAGHAHELLARTDRQIKRLDRLVGDLLDVSRIGAGHLEMRVEPADLCEVVRDAVEAQRASWPERRITLDLPRQGSVEVCLDADRIGQVVANYLTNALKYSAERSSVAVRLRLRGGEARVEVRDRGPGLSPEQQSRIWERFHRVPGVAQRSGSGIGLGLGLYISRELVERHGGAVGVESAPGAGSTFWFTLPLAGDDCAVGVS